MFKRIGQRAGRLIWSPLTDRQMFYISMNCNVPYTPAILSGSVTFLEHFHSVFVCFRYVTQISVPVPVPVTFLGDLPGRKSGLRIAGGRKMPMWSRDYSSKWHFLQAGNMLKIKMMIKMLMVMVAFGDIFCATPAHWTVLTCSLGIRRNISDSKAQIRLSNKR